MTVEIRCPISVTMLRNEASSLQRWATTLPPTDEGRKLEAAALLAWNYLRCAAALIPATNEHEFESTGSYAINSRGPMMTCRSNSNACATS
jgi:hypothetical protein